MFLSIFDSHSILEFLRQNLEIDSDARYRLILAQERLSILTGSEDAVKGQEHIICSGREVDGHAYCSRAKGMIETGN